MTGFLIGIVSGAIVGGLASYAKNPLSGQPLRKDVKETVDNFNDSCHRVKNIYHEMEEKNKEEGTDKSKAKVFVDAFSAASFKTLDHKKLFAAIKDKFNHDSDDKVKTPKHTEEKHATPTKVEGDIDSASSASEHEEKETPEAKKVEEKPDSESGASQHEEKDENKD